MKAPLTPEVSMFRVFIILLAVLLISCLDLFKESEPEAGTVGDESTNIAGKVVDEAGDPVVGVVARLVVLNREAVTGEDGHFSITTPDKNSLTKKRHSALAKTASDVLDTLVLSYKGQRFYLKPLLNLVQNLGTLTMATKEIKGTINGCGNKNVIRLRADFNPAAPADKLNAPINLALNHQTGDFSGLIYYHYVDESQTYILDITGYYKNGNIAFSNYMITFQHGTPPTKKGEVKYPENLKNCDTCQTIPYESSIVSWGYRQALDNHVKAIGLGLQDVIALKEDGSVVGWGNYQFEFENAFSSGLTHVKSIASALMFSVALKEDGTVVMWGKAPAVPAGLTHVKAIAAGLNNAIALKEDGTVVNLESNVSGQFRVPEGLTHVKTIAAGNSKFMAIKDDGSVVIWGKPIQFDAPARVTHVKAIAMEDETIIALKEDGTVTTWGLNHDIPSDLTQVKAVASAASHTVILKDDGTVMGWGTYIPPGLTHVKAIAAQLNKSAALKHDGTVVTWGKQADSQLRINAPNHIAVTQVKAIDAGRDHTFALKEDGTVTWWGYKDFYIPPNENSHIKAIAAKGTNTIALKEDGTVFRWTLYITSIPNAIISSGLVDVKAIATTPSGLTGVKAIATGEYHAVALKEDGTVGAWKLVSNKWLDTLNSPFHIPAGLTHVKAIAAGYSHTVALKEDGTVVAWGSDTCSNITDEDGVCSRTTVPDGLANVKAISAGHGYSAALKENGTVVVWGHNDDVLADFPVGLSNVKAIAAGNYHMVALKEDGTVVTWGRNNYGQTNIPVGLSNVKAIAAGSNHTVVLVN